MGRLRGHTTLDASRPLYAKRGSVDRPLTVSGRDFVAGDPFPWQELGLSNRQLYKLWEQRRIGHEQLTDRNGAENPGELVKPLVAAANKKSKAQQRAGR